MTCYELVCLNYYFLTAWKQNDLFMAFHNASAITRDENNDVYIFKGKYRYCWLISIFFFQTNFQLLYVLVEKQVWQFRDNLLSKGYPKDISTGPFRYLPLDSIEAALYLPISMQENSRSCSLGLCPYPLTEPQPAMYIFSVSTCSVILFKFKFA